MFPPHLFFLIYTLDKYEFTGKKLAVYKLPPSTPILEIDGIMY